MRNPPRFLRLPACAVALLLCFCTMPAGVSAGEETWKISTWARWESLPAEHRAAGTDNAIAIEALLLPGTGVAGTRAGRWKPGTANLRFFADNVNAGGNDYRPEEAAFPTWATFVFGDDSLALGAKRRVWLFLKQVLYGFTPSGIRLTYAWGNGLPVGSMYRLRDEETVFVVAGPEEAGKTVSVARRLETDFLAAYGRPPKGTVTKIVAGLRRPPREKGTVRASVTVGFPAD